MNDGVVQKKTNDGRTILDRLEKWKKIAYFTEQTMLMNNKLIWTNDISKRTILLNDPSVKNRTKLMEYEQNQLFWTSEKKQECNGLFTNDE